jgi:hypothetical protein
VFGVFISKYAFTFAENFAPASRLN